MSNFDFIKLGKDIDKASVLAMNRAAQSAITAASSFIREIYAIKKADLDANMKIVSKATANSPIVTVAITRNAIQLIKFNATPIGKGGRTRQYSAKTGKKLKKGVATTSGGQRRNQGVKATERIGARKLYRSAYAGAFIATMKSGHQGVFIREQGIETTTYAKHVYITKSGSKTRMYKEKGEKIREMFGPVLTSLIDTKRGSSRVIDVIQDRFNEVYAERLQHELAGY